VLIRIFQVGCRAFTDGKEGGFRHSGGMTYSDFFYFMLAEEDKSSAPSLTYWYRCADLDANGVLTPDELSYFYRSQLHRITSMVGKYPALLCSALLCSHSFICSFSLLCDGLLFFLPAVIIHGLCMYS
jgi:serine/threonine-protein phosphatase 2A regulatory subunit B''